jgi:K+-transporting ATPase A subunit
LPILPAEDLREEISMDVPVEIDWFIMNRGRQHYSGEIHLMRFSTMEAWKIDSDSFLKENHLK